MSKHKVSPLQTILKDERGQMLPIVAVMICVVLLGFVGFVVDVGRAYVGYRQLQASTDAAALAATQSMPNTTNATAAAVLYGGSTTGKNAVTSLKNVGMVTGYPQYKCLTVSVNLACLNSAGGATGSTANAIVVKQSGTVNTTFGALIGFKTFTVTATATASMAGAVAPPYNVAIVIDTTASMQDTDNDSSCAASRISCALSGVQILLQNMNPCIAADASNCGSAVSGNVSNPVDKVAIFTYPNITVGTVVDDTNCGSTNPTAVAYTFPSTTGTTYAPTGSTTPTYQVVTYSSDYKSSDNTSTLNSTSNLSAALGAGPSTTTTTTTHGRTTTTTTPCAGMAAPGGEGTFFAGAIYAAQASLVAAQAVNPQAQSVMIILSDGDACAGASSGCTGSASAMAGASTTGTYPSTKDQCHQAITAAQAAHSNTTTKTKVYTVAYGAAASGCASDSPTITPCQTMQQMASDASTFFSDYTATGSGTGSSACISAANSISSLPAIFTKISGSLTLARLLPDSAN